MNNNVIVWKPKKHLRFHIYTFLLSLNLGTKWKDYWFTKRCNLINKPLFDALKNLKAKPLKKIDWDFSENDYEWTIEK